LVIRKIFGKEQWDKFKESQRTDTGSVTGDNLEAIINKIFKADGAEKYSHWLTYYVNTSTLLYAICGGFKEPGWPTCGWGVKHRMRLPCTCLIANTWRVPPCSVPFWVTIRTGTPLTNCWRWLRITWRLLTGSKPRMVRRARIGLNRF